MSWQCFLPKNADISKEHLKNAYDKNSDGAGIGWAKNGELFISKGFFNFDDFYTEYEKVGLDCVRLIFFRWSVAGGKNELNCQPFLINEGLMFTQSGTLTHFMTKQGKCDTLIYNETALQPLLKNNYLLIHEGDIQWLLTTSAGSHNKLAFLTKDGQAVIINADKGEWDTEKKNVWYSNKDHLTAKYIYNYSTQNNVNTTTQNRHAPSIFHKDLGHHEKYDVWIRKCYQEAIKLSEIPV